MKHSKEITHFEQTEINNYDMQQWLSFYNHNFVSYSYDGVPGYIQATIDYLRSKGFKVIKDESSNK